MSNSLRLLENILGSNSKVAVLRVLLQSKLGYSGKEVARRAGMGLLAIQNALADLEGCGLVEVHRGRVEHRYRLNTEHYLVPHGLRQLYAGEREMLKSLASELRQILEGKVVAAGLFGSAARGEAKSGSDIDLMVIVNSAKEYDQVNNLLLEPIRLLSKRYGWPIQQVVYKKKDLRKDAQAMTALLVNVKRDWVHVAGEDLHKLRNEFSPREGQMSPRPTQRRRVSRHRAEDYWREDYWRVATRLMESARALVTLGDEEYGNAIGICLIHAVISANDAVTINVAEVRSSGEQHADASRLLRDVVPDVPGKIVRALSDVVQAKFEYEYSGEVFTQAAAKRLLRKAERFYTWADDQLH